MESGHPFSLSIVETYDQTHWKLTMDAEHDGPGI